MRWVVALLLLAAAPLGAQEDARRWLEDMSVALRTLDYDGTFVYLHDGKLEAMRSMIPARKKRRARVRKLPDDPLAGGEPPESGAGSSAP